MLKRVSAGRSHSPGSNLTAADSTGLPHPFEVPIDRPSGEMIAHVQIVATLVPAAIEKVRSVRIEPGIVSRQLSGADRKSTRLNSSHLGISYAVFCLKKKTNIKSLYR